MNNRPYKQGKDRLETAVLPQRIEDFVGADNPVRAIDAYVELLGLTVLGFDRIELNRTSAGQSAFPPAAMLMCYL